MSLSFKILSKLLIASFNSFEETSSGIIIVSCSTWPSAVTIKTTAWLGVVGIYSIFLIKEFSPLEPIDTAVKLVNSLI